MKIINFLNVMKDGNYRHSQTLTNNQPSIRPTTGFKIRSLQYLRIIEDLKPGSAVDIGGGQGYWALRLAQMGWNVDIVEKSERARKEANCTIKRSPSKIQIFDKIKSIEKHSVDLICALEVLEHLPQPHKELQTWSKILKEDGYGLFSFPAWPEWFGPEDQKAGHIFRFNRNDALELFSSLSDWKLCKILGYGFPYRNFLQIYNNWRFRHVKFNTPLRETLSSGIYNEVRLPLWIDFLACLVTDFCQRLIGPRKPNWGLVLLLQKNTKI